MRTLRAIAVVLLAAASSAAAAPEASAPAEADAKPAAWRVDAPLGPTREVAFTVEEGTWLHLDVHPDGRRLVFSLLGDLYVLPIGGGEAQRITHGPAYDVQPAWSPDGRSIAFASDRSGLENLWVCDLDGGNPRPLSQEQENPVSAPAWSPDGDYLVGRKRVLDSSALATVELWLWHRNGGSGVRLTKREEQPDAADPAFSPDGRFVYFSARDARYRYDRNVNEGIWQLKRLDRRTGRVSPLTDEFGGAATPTPSPDGRHLAFVRRVRAKTRLELMELATGEVRTLAEGLERDLQEGFAFHGVFPGFAWTPDGRALIATADGRITRFDAESGARSPIPFRAEVRQTLTEALRFPRRLGEPTLRVRMIAWPTESPDGKTLVFGALGRLWRMALPDGEPRPITGEDELAYAPTFSPDGRELAYVTWSDAEGGHVWKRRLSRGRPTRVTRVPAQYANPAFSPDGERLVFLKGSGATFRGGEPGDELWFEIREAPARGGESRYVTTVMNRGRTRRTSQPVYAPDGQRIFFVEDQPAKEWPADPPRTLLVSVALDGSDRREHLRFERADEIVVSPDGRHVAVSEQHEAYVTVLPSAPNGPIEVALDGGALPIGRLSRAGGAWVGWADRGRSVTWSVGPHYARVPLEAAIPLPRAPDPAAEPGEKAEPELPDAEEIEIRLEVPRAAPSGTVAYRGARIVTMRGDEVIDAGTLVVEANRIRAVGPLETVAIPAGARVVELAGRTLIPGLFDAHAHLHYAALDVLPERSWKYDANLAYGVTATHEVSAPDFESLAQGERVEAGRMVGPRIFSTGEVLYGANSPGRSIVKSYQDALRHVRRMKAQGAFSVKSYMQPGRNQRQWIAKAAREEGLLVVPEGGGDLELDMTLILDGHTTLEHALPVAPLREDVIRLFSASGTAYTPTLLVAYGGLSGDRWFHQHHELWRDERLARFVPQRVIDVLGRIRSVMATDPADWHHLSVARAARELLRAGTRVNLGSHGQLQGLGAHWEIWAFVQGGMTPLEALRVATRLPAETLGLDADLGSLEPGKLADFVVLSENPLEDIQHTTSIELVVKNGRAWRPEELALPRR